MSEQTFRVALIAIRLVTTEESVVKIVDAALNGPEDPPKKALSSKERQQRRRDKNKHSNGHQLDLGVTENVTDDVTNVTLGVTGNVTNVTGNVTRSVTRLARGELLDSLSFHEDTETERESACAGEPQSVTRVTASSRQTSRDGVTASSTLTHDSDAERYVQPGDKLTDELRAIAAGATGGPRVVDVEGAWLKFCGHYAGKWLHVAGGWQKWCVTEAAHERANRDKLASAPDRYNSPAQLEERRERAKRDRVHDEQAVPASAVSAQLMAALGPRKVSPR